MMNKRYVVRLACKEREELLGLIRVGKAAAYKLLWARILLKADQGVDGPALSDEGIAQALETTTRTVERLRQRLVEEGLDAAMNRKKRETPSRPPVLDGKSEAHLIAIGCSEPPQGRGRWTVRLLADKLVELEVVESVSRETVRRALKKMNLSLG
jgi:transposase